MLNFFELNILPLSEQLEYMLNGTEPTPKTEQYLCPSYFDDDGILQDCSCGKCK